MFVFVDVVVVVVQSSMHNSAAKSVNPTKPIVFKKAEDCFFLARLHFFSFAPRFRFFVVANKGRVFCWFLLQKRSRFCC